MRLLSSLALGVLFVLGSAPASAGEEVELGDAERQNGRLRFTVSTPGGPLLTAEDFEIEINDIAAPDIVASPRSGYDSPGGAVLVLDTSGSMTGRPFADAKRAVTSFTRKVDPATELSLIAFSSKVRLLSSFTSARDRVRRALKRLIAAGETSLHDAVIRAVDEVAGRPAHQRNIVLLSDGADTVSKARLADAIEAAGEADATVFAVGLKSSDYSGEPLKALTRATGGTLLQTSDSSRLSELFNDLARELVSSYVISVRDPDPKAVVLEVHVTVGSGEQQATGSRIFRFPVAPSQRPRELPSVVDVPLPLLLLLVFAAAAVCAFIASEWVRKRRVSAAERIAWYVDDKGAEHLDSEALINAAVLRRAESFAMRLAEGTGFLERLKKDIEAAAMRWRPGEVLVASALLGSAAGLLGTALWGPFIGVILALAGGCSLIGLLKIKASRRRKAFAEQLPDVLMLMGGALKAGYSLQQALAAVGEDAKPPASEEFKRTMAEVRLGGSLDDSLKALSDRIALIDFEWTVLATQIQREVGGNLAEILETISDTIRERGRLRRQIRALTAEGRLSALILGILPFAMAGILTFINPEYLVPLVTTSLGKLMLSGAAVLLVIGFAWMRKIIRIEV